MDNHSKHTINTGILAKYFSGEANNEEITQVENWKNSSEENLKEFNEFNLVWLDTGILKEYDSSIQIDTDVAWGKLQQKITPSHLTKVKPTFNWKYTLRIAALLAVVFGATWYFTSDNSNQIDKELLASNEVVNFTFSDSSKIVLNKNSKISYPEEFSEKDRKVKLSGEAHFSVTPNKEKPFVIEVEKAIVKVLGTSFVVKEMKEDSLVKVMVETGKVLFAYKEESVILTKGMSASLDLRTELIVLDSKPDLNIGAWKSKNLLFRSTNLAEVINQIEDLYEVDIVVENQEILNCELSATFNNEILEDVLMIIESTFGFEIDYSKNKILIRGDGC